MADPVGQPATTTESLAPWAAPYVTDMLGKGQALSNMPFTAYSGPLTAGASPLQQQAFSGLASLSMPSTITGAGMGYGGSSGFPAVPTYQPMQQSPPSGMIGNIISDWGPNGESGTRQPDGSIRLLPQQPMAQQMMQSNIGRVEDHFGSPKGSMEDLPLEVRQLAERFFRADASPPTLSSINTTYASDLYPSFKDRITLPDFLPEEVRRRREQEIFALPDDYRGENQPTDLDPMFAGARGPDDRPLEGMRPATQEDIERFRATSQPGGLGGISMPAGTTQQQPMQQGAPQQKPMQQGAPTTQQQIASLMNPYIEQALNPQLEAAKRQAEIQAQNLQSQYGRAGAYGGSRQGVAEAELQRGLLDRMAGLTGTGYQQAYDKAVDLLGKERSYGLDVLREQQAGGETQRGIESQGIAADYAQFTEERDYPQQQTLYQQQLLQGLPIGQKDTSYVEPSSASGAFGILGTLAEIYKKFAE